MKRYYRLNKINGNIFYVNRKETENSYGVNCKNELEAEILSLLVLKSRFLYAKNYNHISLKIISRYNLGIMETFTEIDIAEKLSVFEESNPEYFI